MGSVLIVGGGIGGSDDGTEPACRRHRVRGVRAVARAFANSASASTCFRTRSRSSPDSVCLSALDRVGDSYRRADLHQPLRPGSSGANCAGSMRAMTIRSSPFIAAGCRECSTRLPGRGSARTVFIRPIGCATWRRTRDGVTATFMRRDGSEAHRDRARGDVLIAADGIHSTVRGVFYPDEGPPTWNGIDDLARRHRVPAFSHGSVDDHRRGHARQAGALSDLEPDERVRDQPL